MRIPLGNEGGDLLLSKLASNETAPPPSGLAMRMTSKDQILGRSFLHPRQGFDGRIAANLCEDFALAQSIGFVDS